MFGFLNPRPHSWAYRRAYARLCQHQRRSYGMLSLPFHSYEAVFLYQCALDAGAFSAGVLPHVRCCKLAAPGSLPREPDAAVGRFCASVALLLGSIKLEDDVRDARGLPARIARWLLRKRIARARGYFARLDPRFHKNIEQLIGDHHAMEAAGVPVPLDRYAEPTALSFGYVFGLMARLRGLEDQRELLAALGRHLGEAIIAFDCAVDWKRDRRRGEFNPLADEDAVADALLRSADRLADAETLTRRELGPDSRAAATLAAVRARILRANLLAEPTPCPVRSRSLINRVRRAARFALVPVMSSAEPAHEGEHPPQPPGDDELSRKRPHLPGGVESQDPEKEKQKKGRGNRCCADDDWCYCCLCAPDACQCAGGLGECLAGADCCAGAECCACAG
jgi:hypothetical protein